MSANRARQAELAANWRYHVPGAGTQRFLGDGALQFGAAGRLVTIEIAHVDIYSSEVDAVARVLKDSVTAS